MATLTMKQVEERRAAGAKIEVTPVPKPTPPPAQEVVVKVESEPQVVEVAMDPVDVRVESKVDVSALVEQVAKLTAIVGELIELRKNPPELEFIRRTKDDKILRVKPVSRERLDG